jgi:hypothetical protein
MPMDLVTVSLLVDEFPTHAQAINKAAAAGREEASIRAEISDLQRGAEASRVQAEVADYRARLASVEASIAANEQAHSAALDAQDQAHVEALAAKDAEIIRLQRVAGVAGGAAQDPGGGECMPVPKPRSEMSLAERGAYQAEYGHDAYRALPF